MTGKIVDGRVLDLDRSELIEISKPLFYGYVFLAGISMLLTTNQYAGALLGVSGLASLAFVSAGLAEGVKDDWQALLDLVSVTSLLLTVFFSTYTAVHLSMGL
jgi:hypothetical protein